MPTVEDLRALSHEIDELVASGKEEEGLSLLEKALEQAKDNPAYLLFFQGEKEGYANKNHKAQEELFRKALEIAPADGFLMRNMGVCLSLQQRPEEAIQWYDKALAVNPQDYRAMRQRGIALSKLDREEEAIEWYDKALEVNPKDSDAMRQRGVALAKLGKNKEALQWVDKALEINPKDSDAQYQKAIILNRISRKDETKQQEQEIKKFHKQAQQLLQEMEEARSAILGSTSTHQDGTEQKEPGLQEQLDAELAKLKAANEAHQIEFQKLQLAYSEKYNNTFERIEELLPGATSAGLSEVYSNAQQKHEEKARTWWQYLCGALVAACAFIFFGPKILACMVEVDATKHPLFSWEIWLYFRLPLGAPLLFFIWKANQKINQHTRLAEEYAHKEAVARNFEGFRKALAEHTQAQGNLFNKAIDVYGHNPSASLDNKNHCRTIVNELCECAKGIDLKDK